MSKSAVTKSGPGGSRLGSYIAAAAWLPTYKLSWLRFDVIAGVALFGLLIPEGMGYAGIAGLPAQAGLYAALAGLFIYALLGSSRQLAVSATSATAVVISATAGPLSGGDPLRYAALTSALVLCVGLIFLVAWAARLGFVSDFIAMPVISGFVFGLALIIIVRQAPKLLGIPGGTGNFFQMAWQDITHLGSINLPTMTIGALTLITLIVLGNYGKKLPAALLVLVAGIVITYMTGLQNHGVAIVGSIPSGLPTPVLPNISWSDLTELIPAAAGIVLVAYAEGLGSARVLADRHRYEISPNEELRATGLANIGSGLLGGIAVAGGLSGSSANDSNGAKTELSAMVASAFILITLLWLTSLFYYLPEAVLGAIVVYAVRHMLNAKEIIRFMRIRHDSLGMTLPAMAGVLIFGILAGLALAVMLSLAILARELSRPRVVLLGKLKETGAWVNAGTHPDASRFRGLAIYRIQGVLFFASANVVRNTIRNAVQQDKVRPDVVAIDLEILYDMDVSSVIMLDGLCQDLQKLGIKVVFTNVHKAVQEVLQREGLYQRLGPKNFFGSVDEAVAKLGS